MIILQNNSVKQLLKDMEEASFIEQAVRFTVTLNERDNRRLEYFSRRLNVKRAEMARKLLVASLNDAEEVFGLDYVIEDKQAQGKFSVTDYQKYLNGEISLDDLMMIQGQESEE